MWLSNAGVAGPRQPGNLQDDSLWDLMWRLHVLSHLHAAREVLPSMIDRGDGYLLQTASSVALSTQPEKAAYSVTKHAALALAEWLAMQYRRLGIKVSCFCPGPMLTRMLLGNEFAPGHPALEQVRRLDRPGCRPVPGQPAACGVRDRTISGLIGQYEMLRLRLGAVLMRRARVSGRFVSTGRFNRQ